MKHSIFLCDKQWIVDEILHCSSEIPIQTGTCLKDLISDPGCLDEPELADSQQTNIITAYFPDIRQEIPVIICTFSEYYLVFLALIQNQQDFVDFTETYTDSLSWAKQRLHPMYTDEYFQIEQMNNQLINSQRALMKSNQKLQSLLAEIRQASNAIAILEQDDLTALYSASAFYRRVEKCIQEHPDQVYDIIALDIERFKLVNEIYGRVSGDRMLKSLALFMLGLPHADAGIFARASADTFYIFMPEEFHFYWVLHEEVSAYFESYPLPLQVREKIGFCSTADSSDSIEEMCDKACLAMDNVSSQEEGRILKERRDLGLRSLPISVNVARGDLYEKNLCEVFDQLLQKYDLPGNLLHLEIIERAYVNDTDNITHILNALREEPEQADILTSMGCRYAQGYFYHRPAPAAAFLEIP